MQVAQQQAGTEQSPVVFSFGEPESVLDRAQILDYIQALDTGRWYEPPVSLHGLADSFRASPHHSSAIYVKRNILVSTFKPHPLLSAEVFSRLALDYLVMGNGYLAERRNRLGRRLPFDAPLAKYMRRGSLDLDAYFYIPNGLQEHEYEPGSVFHLVEHDVHQDIYGVPEYLGALQSAWLNESATLFRRRYYRNGSHAGYILYMTDAAQDTKDIDALRKAIKDSKGPGNFRNLFMYAPNGKKEGLQVIPLSEVTAKDEFFNIKNATRDDILAAHRVPPQLLGIIPNSTGGFGPVADAARVFVVNELKPLQIRMAQLNTWAGEEVMRFNPYELAEKA